MKRNILAICDPEQEYAYRLMDALSQKADFPFEMLTFTSADKLRESLMIRPVQLLLISQSVFDAEMKNWPVSGIILLWESERPPEAGLPGISKYSSVIRIMKKITETAVEAGNLSPSVITDHPVQIYGIYTPVGRCLQTTFSFAMGQVLARNHRVLYVNFEGYSGLERMLFRTFDTDFSDLLYFLQEPEKEVHRRLYGMVENINGMDIIPPAFSGFDVFQMGGPEWIRFMEILQSSRYEYVLFDLADGVQGLPEILRRCSRIFTIVREDGFAAAKLAQYEEMLKKADYGDVLEKTKKCRLPLFQKLPRDLNHAASGELAQAAERMLQDDEQGGI